jgi:hypothetical protein
VRRRCRCAGLLIVLAVSEVAAVLVEGALYTRRNGLLPPDAFLASLLANLASFGTGFLLSFWR